MGDVTVVGSLTSAQLLRREWHRVGFTLLRRLQKARKMLHGIMTLFQKGLALHNSLLGYMLDRSKIDVVSYKHCTKQTT
jgi:hypothetical protein